MKRHLLPLACFLLSLAVLASAISPRFDERNYTLLADSPVTRSYFTSWARYPSSLPPPSLPDPGSLCVVHLWFPFSFQVPRTQLC